MNDKRITPRILQGTRDFLPQDMAKRDYILAKLKSVFTNFGYDTIATPSIEYAETILGKYGDEAGKLVYRFEDNGGRDIALRYDQTVPFARLFAMNYKDLALPFKRYQVGRVWRADRPQKGRYREFWQCDVDIIGTDNLLSEAEIAALMDSAFRTLGFSRYEIRFNSRRLINTILESLKIDPMVRPRTIQILDKLDKVGLDGVIKELSESIPVTIAKRLLDTVSLRGTTTENLDRLDAYDTAEIREFLRLATLSGVDPDRLIFDPSLARGLDYYTGIIFEAFLPDVKIGAVCAGGRYDDLCSMFCDERFSGVGVAFGFDRLVVAMEELGLLADAGLNSSALVTYFDADTLPYSLFVLNMIRAAGVNAEIYFEPQKLAKQFQFSNRKGVPFVVICGETERERDEVTVKAMRTGKQKTIPRTQLSDYLRSYGE